MIRDILVDILERKGRPSRRSLEIDLAFYKSTAVSLHHILKEYIEVPGAIENARKILNGQEIRCLGEEALHV